MKKIFTTLLLMSFTMILRTTPAYGTEEVPDGSFENFDDTWECDANCLLPVNDYFILSSEAVEGIAYAYIFHEAGIYQDLTIPSDATNLALWYDNQNDDAEEGSFTISLHNIDTNEVYTQQLFDEQSDIWINRSMDIPAELQGQTVRLHIVNITGYNRIDLLQFRNRRDEIEEEDYATVKLRVFSHTNKPVKNAKMFIKQSGKRLSLFNENTEETVKSLQSNAKGRMPKFTILQEIAEGDSVKLCVKKKTVTECAAMSPEANATTSYDFTFTNRKVK